MAERFIQSHIKRLLLFERLPDDQLALVADAFQVLRFEPGTLVFQQGQPAQGLFYFVSGRGILTHTEPATVGPGVAPVEEPVGSVSANEYIGEQSLFAQMLENASLRIVESSIVLFLSRQRLAALLMAHPELRVNLGMQRGDQHRVVKPLFKGQRTDEVVLQQYRRHWWSFGRFAWIPMLIAAALVAVAFLVVESSILALSLLGVALLIPAGVMWYIYVEWQDDAIIVTDQRVVRVNNVWLGVQTSISEIPLDRVLEVSVAAPPADPFARIFNYGRVNIKTTTQLGNLSLSFVQNPDQLRNLIFTYREQFRQSVAVQQKREIQAEVDRVLGLTTGEGPAGAIAASANSASSANTARQYEGNQPGFDLLRTRFTNEDGDTVFRKHVTVWFAHIVVPLLVVIGGVVLGGLSLFASTPSLGGVGVLVGGLMVVGGSVWLYLGDWDWRNDQFILSDDMLTFIRRRPLWLQAEIDQIRLAQVDSVISSINGLINNMLDKGNVRISLIGTEQPKEMFGVHHPREIQAEISQRQARMRTEQQQAEAEKQREAITDYLAAYHEKIASTDVPPAQAAPEFTVPRDVSIPTRPSDPPPQPIRDAVRPPRIPRVNPDQ